MTTTSTTRKDTYLYQEDYSDDLSLVQFEDSSWGFINRSGEKAFEATFPLAYSFSEGLAAVHFDDGYAGFITTDGRKAFSATFLLAASFKDGSAAVTFKNERDGRVDRYGQKIERKPSRLTFRSLLESVLGFFRDEQSGVRISNVMK